MSQDLGQDGYQGILQGRLCHRYHLYFNYNYRQYTTLQDRLGGSCRRPNPELFSKESKIVPKEQEGQVKEMEQKVEEVEGVEYRSYMIMK